MEKETFVTSSSTYTGQDYKHNNGWYFTIKGWIFDKRYFWCDDCKKALRVKNGKIK